VSNSTQFGKYDIKIDLEPQTLESRKLAVPQLIHKEGDDNKLYACEKLLKQMPVFSCEEFEKYELVLIHDKFARNEAENAKRNLENCQKSIKMKSGEIMMVQMDDFRGNFNALNDWFGKTI